ncbi:endo-1,4-beta-xylanase [Azospirillum agricola]|uniref:endo-1,4-beta-xylanase n=1 Tax=Azospirillum agricola TaxID=1720247 RepID=UPI000A0EEF33|nr:endo-1,4-beta-xylanase [Azospirillum agricola]SMH44575.1 endo-1,4-beta-xylanase [Azospirillum lipoferum]
MTKLTLPFPRRRDVLRVAACAAVLASCRAATDPTAAIAAASHPDRPDEPAVTLRDVCRAAKIRHGAARDHFIDPEDPALDRLMARECDVVTPENGGKWAVFQPEEGYFDWRRMDASVELARGIGAMPNWHTIIWQHMGMPPYMKLPVERQPELGIAENAYFSPDGTLGPDTVQARFADTVARVKARYGDSFYRIDVANEVFFWETADSHPQEQDRFGFRRGMWWVAAGGAEAGPEWLDPFFHQARAAFPNAKLVINEFGIELNEGWQQRKRAYLLDWLTGAVKRGVPLDGIGLQSHLIAGKPYDREGMRRFLRAVDRLGLAVHITEMDVDETRLPRSWSRAEKDRTLALLAGQYLSDVAANSRLEELVWWHLRSDLNFIARENAGLDPQPSPYDRHSRPLPMYEAAVQALRGKTRAG